MWRVLRLAASLVFALVSISASASGQSLPDKREVSRWVKKALDSNILQDPDGSPYHLVAKVRHTMDDKSEDGTYEILWAAPDRYRIEFRMGDTGETDVVLGDKKYIERNTPTMTLAMWSVSGLLIRPASLDGTARNDAVRKLSFSGKDSTRQICALVGEHALLDNEFCFNAANTELVSQHIRPHASASKAAITLDLTDYLSLGKLRYPRHLLRRIGSEWVYAYVEKWESVQTFGPDVFLPLPHGTVWSWCSNPEVQKPEPLQNSPFYFFVKRSMATTHSAATPHVGLYKVVGIDGAAKNVTELYGPQGQAMKEFLDQERQGRSPILTCGGKPMEYEEVITFRAFIPMQ